MYVKHEIENFLNHSMGYAHALGAIKVLQDIGLKIGALYCLAPEGAQFTEKNPECMEVLSKIDIKEQFGSDENKDTILKRDYIAPQSPISVSKVVRHYHQVGNIKGIGFLDAHRLKPVFKKEFGADDAKKDDIFSKEIKSGKITNTGDFQRQVKKDIEIILQQRVLVTKIEWHALDGIDENALKFIREQMSLQGVDASKFKIIIY